MTTTPAKPNTKAQRAYDDYVRKATKSSETVETFYLHVNDQGLPWCVSMGTQREPTRDEMIAGRMDEETVIILGAWPDQTRFSYRMSYEEAEQAIDLLYGVYPPVRMLCTANPDTVARLDARYGYTSRPAVAA